MHSQHRECFVLKKYINVHIKRKSALWVEFVGSSMSLSVIDLEVMYKQQEITAKVIYQETLTSAVAQ